MRYKLKIISILNTHILFFLSILLFCILSGRRGGEREKNGFGSAEEYDTNDSGSVISSVSDVYSQEEGGCFI